MASNKKKTSQSWRDIPWLERVRYETFTKAQAKIGIEKAIPDKRKLRMDSVSSYMDTMNRGFWWAFCPSQIPLMFNEKGERMNGNTRLNAFYASDLETLVFPVIRNIPSEAYSFIDADMRSRSAKDALHDRDNVSRDMARVNWLHGLITGNIYYVSPIATLEHKFSKIYQKELSWIATWMRHGGKYCRAPFAVAFMYVYRAAPDFADKWAQAWVEGDLASHPALRKLREDALSSTGKAPVGGGREYTHTSPTFKLLNALALLHQDKHLGRGLKPNAVGFKYWSEIIKDGAYATHAQNPS